MGVCSLLGVTSNPMASTADRTGFSAALLISMRRFGAGTACCWLGGAGTDLDPVVGMMIDSPRVFSLSLSFSELIPAGRRRSSTLAIIRSDCGLADRSRGRDRRLVRTQLNDTAIRTIFRPSIRTRFAVLLLLLLPRLDHLLQLGDLVLALGERIGGFRFLFASVASPSSGRGRGLRMGPASGGIPELCNGVLLRPDDARVGAFLILAQPAVLSFSHWVEGVHRGR